MKIAVLSLTRDRLPYTRHCFATLEQNAGCAFDHYVLDQASEDGTFDWLTREFNRSNVVYLAHETHNIGISAGMNKLLDAAIGPDSDVPYAYDVVVKFDNDCELLTPNTLRDVCALVDEYGLLLSPRINGLNEPPATIGGTPLSLGGALVDEKAQIGGIFLAAPAAVYTDHEYRYSSPPWGLDDAAICAWWRANGGRCGYVHGYEANHYLTTAGQRDDQPGYFERKFAEMSS